MFKRNQFQKAIVAAGITLVSCAGLAQQTEPTTATVTVQNAFTITEDAALSFGTITARVVSGETSSFELNPDGTTESPVGNIRSLVPGNAAAYTIAGAAPFTPLSAKLNLDAMELVNASAPPTDPKFDVDTFRIQQVGETEVDITSASAGSTFTTDANGELVLNLGATLKLADGATKTLVDGTYSGTFSIIIEY